MTNRRNSRYNCSDRCTESSETCAELYAAVGEIGEVAGWLTMHAGALGRPAEALRISRMVLETNRLSPRLEALFRMREARALAQAGDECHGEKLFPPSPLPLSGRHP
ncbi:hypothetical protein [Nocardia farcinica]|uniref:hypothetical protein n=1 Tax=Nocardia farcinica TaxID=37329 RepID=UPI0024579B46|nr:hypothetical protein [Nocardia farcinica]